MNNAAYAGVAAYLLGMAVSASELVNLTVGITTITEVQQRFSIIDNIGMSYTGGPVLNLSEWELNLEGLVDIQLAFNASGILDVATAKADKLHFEEVVNGLKSQLIVTADESYLGFAHITFLSGTTEVVVEAHSLDTQFTINYISADFKIARSQAQKRYA
ncbi:hypothetical protein QZH44_30510 (plasmid) [Pseudomonas corrugata]|uniref:hypothetical protein n=1 Tax=Pseudomonas corrugata TaxID=47879 RepID=UPI003D814F4A